MFKPAPRTRIPDCELTYYSLGEDKKKKNRSEENLSKYEVFICGLVVNTLIFVATLDLLIYAFFLNLCHKVRAIFNGYDINKRVCPMIVYITNKETPKVYYLIFASRSDIGNKKWHEC